MTQMRDRPLTGVTMAVFSRMYANRMARNNFPTPRTPSQNFDIDAACTRVRAMLAEMYADESESDDSDQGES